VFYARQPPLRPTHWHGRNGHFDMFQPENHLEILLVSFASVLPPPSSSFRLVGLLTASALFTSPLAVILCVRALLNGTALVCTSFCGSIESKNDGVKLCLKPADVISGIVNALIEPVLLLLIIDRL